jgi:hypothetical protein
VKTRKMKREGGGEGREAVIFITSELDGCESSNLHVTATSQPQEAH